MSHLEREMGRPSPSSSDHIVVCLCVKTLEKGGSFGGAVQRSVGASATPLDPQAREQKSVGV